MVEKVAGAKDLDKTVAFYADDRDRYAAEPSGRDDKRWNPKSLERISRQPPGNQLENNARGSGQVRADMAVLTGTYEMTMKDGNKDKGKYCEVGKRSQRKMEIGTDMFSSDLPGATCNFTCARCRGKENNASGAGPLNEYAQSLLSTVTPIGLRAEAAESRTFHHQHQPGG